MDLADVLADPERAKALFCWNINIAASNPEQERLRASLAREDLLLVAADLFPTDTTDYADYVLPAASFLESNDLVASYFHLTLSAQVKVEEPPGEALPNTEIFRRLAAAMDFDEPELYDSDEDLIEHILAGVPSVGDSRRRGRSTFSLSRSSSSPTSNSRRRAGRSSSRRIGQSRMAFRARRFPLRPAPREREAAPPLARISLASQRLVRQ
jgi:anaerobic selenocysteine-containing dehydrogenase